MAQNVMVMCRFRPPNKNERADGSSVVVEVDDSCTTVSISEAGLAAANGGSGSAASKFNFDHAFHFTSTQEEVYQRTAQPMVKEIFAGYNCTVFAYGQTGSGKTHTMLGGKGDLRGIIPRLVESIFQGIDEADAGLEFTVKLSYVEIYNERVRDLLTSRSAGSDNLRIREAQHGGVYIEGVTETYVNSIEHVLSLMQQGQDNRAIAATKMNAESSRSHSVFILTLGQVDSRTGSKRGAKLTLVDLAGSEKVGKTGAAGQTLDEAKSINKSLSALGNVINALTTSGAHIPYRDSKLTRLLSDSLGGNSRTLLIVTGSPSSSNVDETISTLRFGTRAKLIKNTVKRNEEKSVAEYKQMLQAADNKIKVQGNIIELLETDVAALLECIEAVDGQYLTIPIPSLLSRDVHAMEAAKSGKEVSDKVALSRNNSIEPPKPAPSPSPSPSTAAAAASGATSPKPVPPSAASTTALHPSSPSSGASSTVTSPDTSPETSPTLKAKQPPNDASDLPPIDVAADGNTAHPPPSLNVQSPSTTSNVAPSAATTGPRHRSTSSIATAHSISELLLSNTDLKQQLSDLQKAHQTLTHNFEDLKRESAESTETFENEKAQWLQDLEAERAARKAADDRATKTFDLAEEFEQLKEKLAFDKKEHALALSQAEATKVELQEDIQRLQSKIAAMEQKMIQQAQAHEKVMERVAQESTERDREKEIERAETDAAAVSAITVTAPGSESGTDSTSAPSTPTSKSRHHPTASSDHLLPPPHLQPPSGAGTPAALSADSTPAHSTQPSFSSLPFSPATVALLSDPNGGMDAQAQIEHLSRGLKRKCDQYIQLMMQHQTQGERLEALEVALADSHQRLKDHMAASAKKIQEMDSKLVAAEKLCEKLIESGRYWRQERTSKRTYGSGANHNRIVMPLHGGGKAAAAVGVSSPPAAKSSSAVTSPASASHSRGSSSSSRLSGGFASGARSAISSIQSALNGKSKGGSAMDAFF